MQTTGLNAQPIAGRYAVTVERPMCPTNVVTIYTPTGNQIASRYYDNREVLDSILAMFQVAADRVHNGN